MTDSGGKTSQGQLIKLFEFLVRNSDFASLKNNQIKHASNVLEKLESIKKDDWEVSFPQIEIPILDKKIKVHNPILIIGGTIKCKNKKIENQCISFSLGLITKKNIAQTTGDINVDSCCLKKYSNGKFKRIVRRFHFDFQPMDNIKPISHLQFGGKFQHESHLGNCHYCLEHYLEKPRIFFPPMDLVLVLNFLLKDYNTPLNLMIEESKWIQLVRNSQKIWWSGYWQNLENLTNKSVGSTVHDDMYDNLL